MITSKTYTEFIQLQKTPIRGKGQICAIGPPTAQNGVA